MVQKRRETQRQAVKEEETETAQVMYQWFLTVTGNRISWKAQINGPNPRAFDAAQEGGSRGGM